MELNYPDYMEYAQNAVKNETIRNNVGKVKTLGQFKKTDEGLWEPAHYAGYTMITPTYGDDEANQASLNTLKVIKQKISGFMNPSKTVAAPDNALHMTAARLISGEVFEKSRLQERENKFFNALSQAFNQIHIAGPLQFEIIGLTVFLQGVVAAAVSPVRKEDYISLQLFRDSIYSNDALTGFGVERKRGFNGHISLFYIEEALPQEDKDILAKTIASANECYFSKPLSYQITCAQVRKFDHFLKFYRRHNWPVYRFK